MSDFNAVRRRIQRNSARAAQKPTPSASGSSLFIPSISLEGYGRKTASGERVSPETAMRLGAYYAANRVVSEDVAKLDARAYEQLLPRGKKFLLEHPVTRIFDQEFNPDCDAFVGKSTLLQWAQSYGNGCAEIVRSARGDIAELYPIHPSRITMSIRGGRPIYKVLVSDLEGGKLGDVVTYSPEEIFHLRGVGDQYQGWSIAQLSAESIGLGLAARGFAASFFGNDMSVGTVITLANRVPDDAREAYRASLQNAYAGARKSHGILVLDNGGKVERLGIPPQDAQFIETQGASIEDIARWHRVNPQKIGHSAAKAGWNTLEGANTDHAVDALLPWAIRIEKEAKRKMLRADKRVFLTIQFKTLMRGDFATRTAGYRSLVASGISTPNECREDEDLNPSTEPGADKLWMQGAMAPLSVLEKGPQPSTAPAAKEQAGSGRGPRETEARNGVVEAMLRRSAEKASAKVSKWYERMSAKHEGKLPEFQNEVRSFFEGMRVDLINDFGPALKDRVALWAQTAIGHMGRLSLQAFAGGKTTPLATTDVAEYLFKSASGLVVEDEGTLAETTGDPIDVKLEFKVPQQRPILHTHVPAALPPPAPLVIPAPIVKCEHPAPIPPPPVPPRQKRNYKVIKNTDGSTSFREE